MAFFNKEDMEDDKSNNEVNPNELYGVREGTLFVIDASLPMFKNDPDNPYFLQCVKVLLFISIVVMVFQYTECPEFTQQTA